MTLNLNLSIDEKCDVRMLSPLTLAFIGDTVFDLFVREMLIVQANRPANMLHKLAVQRVCAKAQATATRRLWESGFLTDEEISVLIRGRNAHSNHTPKNASEGDYHLATGLEAVFGFLYLTQNNERLHELFSQICSIFDESQAIEAHEIEKEYCS